MPDEPEDQAAEEQPEEPIGWTVLDPDGNVVATGGQTGIEATADTGEVAGDVDGSD
jgi:hypothetical protein